MYERNIPCGDRMWLPYMRAQHGVRQHPLDPEGLWRYRDAPLKPTSAFGSPGTVIDTHLLHPRLGESDHAPSHSLLFHAMMAKHHVDASNSLQYRPHEREAHEAAADYHGIMYDRFKHWSSADVDPESARQTSLAALGAVRRERDQALPHHSSPPMRHAARATNLSIILWPSWW